MKRFWLTVAHISVIGAGVAGSVLFPPAAWAIAIGVGAVNGLMPSPLTKSS